VTREPLPVVRSARLEDLVLRRMSPEMPLGVVAYHHAGRRSRCVPDIRSSEATAVKFVKDGSRPTNNHGRHKKEVESHRWLTRGRTILIATTVLIICS
jgi:hypothetical protein